MTTNEDSREEETNGGDGSQNNNFISLGHFELLGWILTVFFSPLLLYYYYFMVSMWPWIFIDREICWIWNLRKSSSQCHNNPVLVPPIKLTDTVKYLYYSQTYDLKTRVDIWTRMDVITVEHGTFSQTFNLTMWFFQFITGITFKWDQVIWSSIDLLVWIGIWNKLIIYTVPPDPVRWSCRGFGFLWLAFMLNWVICTKNDFKVFHRKQVNDPSNMKSVKSLNSFNVIHVIYLKICHTIKKMKSLILLSLQII